MTGHEPGSRLDSTGYQAGIGAASGHVADGAARPTVRATAAEAPGIPGC